MSFAKLKVLDFTHLLPGEIVSTLMSDLGAQVLRVERLDTTLNERLPPIVSNDGWQDSLYFWSLHRNKERIKIDLKSATGLEIVKRLAESADIVIENFRPGVMDRLGLGDSHLRALNPRLIYCSVNGYGSASKWGTKPGHDLNFVAETGILYESQDQSGKPIMPSVFVSDYMSGTYAALAITAALYERETSGKGRRVEISMFESALSALAVVGTISLYLKLEPSEIHAKYPDELPNHRVYRCKDGRYLAAAPIEPEFWLKFLTIIERLDLLAKDVIEERVSLSAEIAEVMASKTLAEWMLLFGDANCCVSPVNTVKEAVNFLPEGSERVLTHMTHSRLGEVPQISNPIKAIYNKKVSEWSCSDTATETVKQLQAIGISSSQIEAMKQAKII
ncbi:MAG: CoA transferase [Candidatus Obscuribacterales bacterium]|jgi:crotonobetainyl-CoA:carnitine CoA-transferase CaiB-like acyl-CoA transferase